MHIGFIGLGQMGLPMAQHLLTGGHALTVSDLNAEAVARLVAAGAHAASDTASLARSADLVITMLPGPAQVRQVYLGDGGLLSQVRHGVALVDCSTIDPATAQAVGQAAAAQGNPFADAPVSGGTVGAQAGSLTFMVGCDDGMLDSLRPVLALMGKNTVHCGPVGMGQVAKICNNLLLGISMAGVAEAMSLGLALGMDAARLAQIINTSTGRCWSADTYNPVPGVVPTAPASRGYSGGFATRLMLKDLGLALDAASTLTHPTPMGQQARWMYRQLDATGGGGLDFSAVIQVYAPAAQAT